MSIGNRALGRQLDGNVHLTAQLYLPNGMTLNIHALYARRKPRQSHPAPAMCAIYAEQEPSAYTGMYADRILSPNAERN